MGKIFWEIYPCEKFWLSCHLYVHPSPPVQTVGVEAGQPLGNGSVWANFLGSTRAFLAGNHAVTSNGIKSRKEHETRGNKI